MRQISRFIQHASCAPFFQRKFHSLKEDGGLSLKDFTRQVPLMTLEELVAEKMKSGDPYSSRLCKKLSPPVVFQMEYDAETPLYLALGRADLRGYARALLRCWGLLGLRKGDRVAIFDYGTSPVSYLASAAFIPYLSQGAADLLGCLTICNDGVASMSQRAVEILRFVRPRALFIRSDCLPPFAAEVERQLPRLSDYTKVVVSVENEGLLPLAEQKAYERRFGVPLYRLLRIDAAMFLAFECPECRLLHSWRDLYFLETLAEGGEEAAESQEGFLVVTNWFARTCPTVRYRSQVKGSLAPAGCPRGPKDLRIRP